MRYRTLGHSGIQVSEIGFGTGPTAGLMVFGTPAEQVSAVKRAWDLGITYFDTAPIYGEYASEENLGRALHEAGLRPHIATKVALELPDLDDVAGAVRRSVEDSLRRLRVEAVTLVQVHNRVGAARAARAVSHGQTMVQAAIRFALMHTGVGVVLVGFSAMDQIDEAAGASTSATLTQDDLARLEDVYARISAWAP